MIINHISALAFAKINLNLEVLGRRDNGYHDISTIMQSVSLGDELDVSLTNDGKVNVVTQGLVIAGENLAKKAAELFLSKINSNYGARIILTKHIPLSSGMGGGSADAAAVLCCLNKMLGLPLTDAELLELGLSLGADVPFCIVGGTKRAGGLGELLTTIKALPKLKCLIIKHFDKTSTGDMYQKIDSMPVKISQTTNIVSAIENENLSDLDCLCRNDFLKVSPDKNAQITLCNELKKAGAILSGLSGSGPTVFGLFSEINPNTLQSFKNRYKEVFLCETQNSGVKIIE